MTDLTITTKPGDKYRSIKNPRVYEALRRKGMSKEQAARISNAMAARRHKAVALKAFAPDRVADTGNTGVMVALYPDPAALAQLAAQPGVTEPPEHMHLTLAFLGDSSEAALTTNKRRLIEAVQQWAYVSFRQPLAGTINGLGRFFHAEDDETNAVYVSPDVPGLPELRQSVCEWIEQSGFAYAKDHGFTPHITVAYVPLDAPTPAIRVETPVTFDRVTLAWGDEQYDFLPAQPPVERAAFSVFKDTTGRYRWLTISSSAYRDRDGEIVTTKALEQAVTIADTSGYRGPLRWWHMPGVDIGDCDFQAVHGRFLVESGTFRNERIGAAVASKADQHEISIAFVHPETEPDTEKAFWNIAIFERSLAPAGRVSNLFTRLVVKGRTMDATKVEALKTLVGSDLLAELLSQVETTDKAAQQQGVAYKEDGGAPAPEAKADGDHAPADEALVDGSLLTPEEMAQFGQVVAEAVVGAIGPALDLETKMRGYADEIRGLFAGQQAKKDDEAAQLQAKIDGLETSLKEAKERLATLEGDQPAGIGGYRASQDPKTVLKDDSALRQAQPGDDPLAPFLAGLGFLAPTEV